MAIKELEQGLGFIKRGYNTVEAAAAASTGNGKGKVVFDTTHKIICVGGVAFGGNITDATFNESILTITKATGDPVVINFSDIASASRMMEVFQDFADLMGLDSQNGLDYSGTNYLGGTQGAKSLKDADVILDSKIKEVADAIEGLDGTAGVATVNNGVVTIKRQVKQTDGKIATDSASGIDLAKVATTGDAEDVTFTPYAPTGLGSGDGIDATNVQDAIEQVVDEIIKNEQTTENAIEAIKNAAGLTNNLQYQPGQGTQYIDDATDISDALNKLDEALGQVAGGSVSDVQVGGTSIVGTAGVANIATDGTYNESTNKIATEETVSNAIEDLDSDATIATKSGKKITIKKKVVETNGEIGIETGSQSGIDFADVASTGNAEDVNYSAGSGTGMSATNVKGALDELAGKVANKAVTVEEAQTPTQGYIKSYNVKQGGTTVGTIDIPKDFLVTAAEVDTVTAADKEPGGKFENNPDFQVGDKYIDFTINVKSGTATDEHIYLNVKDLCDVYTAQQNATQVQLAIDANNVISATIVAGSIDTTELADSAVTTAKIADSVVSVSQTVPIIVANSSTATTLATVAGKEIKAKVALFWDEWESGDGQ